MLKTNSPLSPLIAHSGASPRERAFALFCGGIKAQNRFAHKEAIRNLDRAYHLDNSFVLALFVKSWSCVALGRYDEAARALRPVMTRHEELRENYERVKSSGHYQGKKFADKSLLCFIYGDLVAQQFLQELVLGRVVRPTLLQEYLKDPFLSAGAKMVLKHFKSGMDAVAGGPLDLDRERVRFSFAVRNHFIHCDYYLISPLELSGDHETVRSTRLLQIRLIGALPRIDEDLDRFKRNIELKVAQSYFEARRLDEAKTWLEDILRQSPTDIEAGLLLEEIMRLN